MEIEEFKNIMEQFIEKVLNCDFNKLPISDYNKQYLAHITPVISYYKDIYIRTLFISVLALKKDHKDLTIVDYGGGCGFLSLLLKAIKVKKVIYIDRNPQSVIAVREISRALDLAGPDMIICGDSPDLVKWCKENQVKPELLIAIDVIEHIYNLRRFFADLTSINEELGMVFTTGSNPMNIRKKRQLYKEMDMYEKGNIITPNYYTKRLEFITRTYPDIPAEKAREYAALTRGMIYDDIKYFIQSNNMEGTGSYTIPSLQDKHNTCDPETGNYMERILPFEEYAQYLRPHGHTLAVCTGHYYTSRKNPLTRMLARMANFLLDHIDFFRYRLSPYIILAGFKSRRHE